MINSEHVKVATQRGEIDVFRIRVKLLVVCSLNFFLRITRLAYLFDSQATKEHLELSTTLFVKHAPKNIQKHTKRRPGDAERR